MSGNVQELVNEFCDGQPFRCRAMGGSANDSQPSDFSCEASVDVEQFHYDDVTGFRCCRDL
jgi:hypothetical protein